MAPSRPENLITSEYSVWLGGNFVVHEGVREILDGRRFVGVHRLVSETCIWGRRILSLVGYSQMKEIQRRLEYSESIGS